MVDIVVKKAGDLTVAPYKPNLLAVVSDPDIPDTINGEPNPAKESFAFPLGDLPLPKGKFEPWDITPDVSTDVAQVVVTSSVNAVVNDDVVGIDFTTQPPTQGQGSFTDFTVVKTNLDLSSLTEGESFTYGLTLEELPTGPAIIGVLFIDKTLTVDEVKTLVTDMTLYGVPLTQPFIQGKQVAFGANSYTGFACRIPTDIAPAVVGVTSSPSETTPISIGGSMSLVIGKSANGLTLGCFDVDVLRLNNNFIWGGEIVDNPIDVSNLGLFYYVLTADFGGGFENTRFRMDLDVSDTDLTFLGTTYEFYQGGDQNTWDALFPNGLVHPNNTTITQKTFPVGTTNGITLLATVDPLYLGATPKPYGKTVTNNNLLVVTDVTTGSEDFLILSSDAAIQALAEVIDGQDLIIAQQAITIDEHTTLLEQVRTYSEVVVYIGAPNTFNGGPEWVIPEHLYYDTLDQAYEFLITLSPVIKKRIVIDDRLTDIVNNVTDGFNTPGVPMTKRYRFIKNNIILSTMRAYMGEKLHEVTGQPPITTLTLTTLADGFHLESFWGTINPPSLSSSQDNAYAAKFNYADFYAPSGTEQLVSILIGPKTWVYFNDAIDVTTGGSVIIGADAFVRWRFTNTLALTTTINFKLDPSSKLEMSGFLDLPYGWGTGIVINTPYWNDNVSYGNGNLRDITAINYNQSKITDHIFGALGVQYLPISNNLYAVTQGGFFNNGIGIGMRSVSNQSVIVEPERHSKQEFPTYEIEVEGYFSGSIPTGTILTAYLNVTTEGTPNRSQSKVYSNLFNGDGYDKYFRYKAVINMNYGDDVSVEWLSNAASPLTTLTLNNVTYSVKKL